MATKCENTEHNYVISHSVQDVGDFTVYQMTCTKCGDSINPNQEKDR